MAEGQISANNIKYAEINVVLCTRETLLHSKLDHKHDTSFNGLKLDDCCKCEAGDISVADDNLVDQMSHKCHRLVQ